MIEEITKYENEIGKAYDGYEVSDKKVFSSQFYKNLEDFDEPEIPMKLHDIDESVFNKRVIKEMCRSQLRKTKKVPKPPPRKVRRELIMGSQGTKSQPALKSKIDMAGSQTFNILRASVMTNDNMQDEPLNFGFGGPMMMNNK